MNEQLEFDLVHPCFASSASVDALQREAQGLRDQAADKAWLASVQARLNYDENILPTPARDLEELQSIVGTADWQKNRKRYERRAAKNPRAFRSALISLKKLLT